jgi:hypothetical protein
MGPSGELWYDMRIGGALTNEGEDYLAPTPPLATAYPDVAPYGCVVFYLKVLRLPIRPVE